jgi:hypothetical protein
MTLSTASKTGIASIVAGPVVALSPIVFAFLFQPRHSPDFFYFALAGLGLSLSLNLYAAIKSSWWWILAPVCGAAIGVLLIHLTIPI